MAVVLPPTRTAIRVMGLSLLLHGCATKAPEPQPPPPSQTASASPAASARSASTSGRDAGRSTKTESTSRTGSASQRSTAARFANSDHTADRQTGGSENDPETRRAMAGLPLPRTAPAPPTGPEFQAALERRLAASLAAFDSQMKRERERLEQAKAEKRAADFGRPDENLDLAVDEADSEGPSYGDETPTAAPGNVPETKSEQSGDTASEPPDVAAGAAPESIPDGQDDDIVARQIREAAQEETDPGLREKLWEEYRKYKQSG